MRKLWIKLLAPALLFTATALAAEPERVPPQKSSEIRSVEEQMLALKIQLAELEQLHGKDHPDVVATQRKIRYIEELVKKAREGDDKSKSPGKDKEALAKSKLEQMLETALKNNPDIRVADAKAREADAEVNRTRLAVTQKVVQLYQGIEAARANVLLADARLERYRSLAKNKAIQEKLVDEEEAKLVQAKAELSKLEAEAPYLLGQQLHGAADVRSTAVQALKGLVENQDAQEAAIRLAAANLAKAEADLKRWQAEVLRAKKLLKGGAFDQQTFDQVLCGLEAAEAARDAANAQYDLVRAYASPKKDAATISGPMSDKLRAALDKPITLKFDKNFTKLEDVLAYFQKVHPEIIIQARDGNGVLATDASIAGELPFGAALQWLEDSTNPQYCFAVREYGLLFAPRVRMPPDAVLLHDFWKANPKETPKPKEEKK